MTVSISIRKEIVNGEVFIVMSTIQPNIPEERMKFPSEALADVALLRALEVTQGMIEAGTVESVELHAKQRAAE